MAYDLASYLSEVAYVIDSCLKLKDEMETATAQYKEMHKHT
jgi:hypothetical protein